MKRKTKLTVLALLIALFLVIGTSYSFFSANVGYVNKTNTKLVSNVLGLTFDGGAQITCEDMIPGDKCIKTFTVENTSEVATSYNIYFKNTASDFNEDLVYSLKEGNTEVVSETVVPAVEVNQGSLEIYKGVYNSEKSYIKTDINIPAKPGKHEYTLTITFKYKEKDQNSMQGADFWTTIGIDTVQGVQMGNDIRSIGEMLYFAELPSNIGTDFVFRNTTTPPEEYDFVNDVSAHGDGSVLMYTKGNTNYIQTNGKIFLKQNANNFFGANITSLTGLENLDSTGTESFQNTFESVALDELDLRFLDTSSATTMEAMFSNAEINNINLSTFDTSKVTSMSRMFASFKSDRLDLSNFDFSNVETVSSMFSGAEVRSLILPSHISLKDTSLEYMFEGIKTDSLDMNIFDLSNIENISSVFNGAIIGTLNLSTWDSSLIKKDANMFNSLEADVLNISSCDFEGFTEDDLYYLFSSMIGTVYISANSVNNIPNIVEVLQNDIGIDNVILV